MQKDGFSDNKKHTLQKSCFLQAACVSKNAALDIQIVLVVVVTIAATVACVHVGSGSSYLKNTYLL